MRIRLHLLQVLWTGQEHAAQQLLFVRDGLEGEHTGDKSY